MVDTKKWIEDLGSWCPAQIYYYFTDTDGQNWCIYLRQRREYPWTAELVKCDEEFNIKQDIGSWQWIHGLAKEYEWTEYKELEANVLQIIKNKFPLVLFPE